MAVAEPQLPSGPAAPYVGSRALVDGERDLLFGFDHRSRDTGVLRNLVLSSRIMILYAKSGTGKSSLLNTLLIPELRRNGCLVFHFDSWPPGQSVSSLRASFSQFAEEVGASGVGGQDLQTAVSAVAEQTGRQVVLVLDQFEEFLNRDPGDLPAMSSEIASVVRASSIECSVVISLREEFLAHLDPFRRDIPKLFRSAYRMERLSAAELQDSVELPARKLFHAAWEPGIVEDMLGYLADRERDAGTGTGSTELPMVQLICERLWNSGREGKFTWTLYRRLGGAKGILEKYIQGVMPQGRKQQILTAELMNQLALPSGVKVSYAARDLEETLKLPPAQKALVGPELKRLAECGLLRGREHGNTTRYELLHDSLVDMVRECSGCVLADRDARWRRLRNGTISGTVGLILILSFGWYMTRQNARQEKVNHQLEQAQQQVKLAEANNKAAEASHKAAIASAIAAADEAWKDGKLFKELAGPRAKALAPAYFDLFVSHALWSHSGPDRFAEIAQTLKDHQQLMPPDYGVRTPGQLDQALGAPVVLYYSPDRPAMDPRLFAFEWYLHARWVVGDYGIPVPLAVRLEKDPSLERDQFRLGRDARPFTVPVDEAESLLIPPRKWAHPEVAAFHKIFPGRIPAGWPDWRIVPDWSRPIWKIGLPGSKDADLGELTSDRTLLVSGSGLTVLRCFEFFLKQQPQLLFSDDAIDFIFRELGDRYPNTVQEARGYAAKRSLPDALAAFIRAGITVRSLPRVLGHITQYPDLTPDRVAYLYRAGDLTVPARLHGPWPAKTATGSADGSSFTRYRAVAPFLSWRQPEIRVEVGSALNPVFFEAGRMSDGVNRTVERFRHRYYRETGVVLPTVRFYYASKGLPDRALRMELFEADTKSPGSEPVLLPSGRELDGLQRFLSAKLDDLPQHFVTPETVEGILVALPPGMKDWLRRNYSPTDLRLLLRRTAGTSGVSTVRYSGWLLSSLPFWSEALADRLSATDLITAFHRLQTSRADPPPAPDSPDVRVAMERGIESMLDGRLDDATAAFRRIVLGNRKAALIEFEYLWPRYLPQVCLGASALTAADEWRQLDREDLIKTPDPRYRHQERRLLTLQRFAAGDAGAGRELLTSFTPFNAWPAHQAAWVADRFLANFDIERDGASLFNAAASLMKHALERLEYPEAREAARNLVWRTFNNPAAELMLGLLTNLANARTDAVRTLLQVEAAWRLSGYEQPERLAEALDLSDRLEACMRDPRLAPRGEEDHEVLRLARAMVWKNQARSGLTYRWLDAEFEFRALLSSPWARVARAAAGELVELLYERDRETEAARLASSSLLLWPDDESLDSLLLFGSLRHARDSDLKAFLQRPAKTATGIGRSTALASLLVGDSERERYVRGFLDSKHEDADRIRLIHYGLAGGQSSAALRELHDRWAAIAPRRAGWSVRLKAGDASVWPEMLIGRAVGEVSEAAILAPVASAAAWSELHFTNLKTSRRGLLAEVWFYEAMLARAQGNLTRSREYLRRCVDTGVKQYLEHSMAEFLLASGK